MTEALRELAAATSALGSSRRDIAAAIAITRGTYVGRRDDQVAAWFNALAALLVESEQADARTLNELDFAPGVEVIESGWLEGESDGNVGA